jgi:BirA family biotin operon repressor/biotin-[acetyl-CoA-carboxylase] ligase
VTSALRDLGRGAVSIKWPNDVMAPAGKLAGILVDVAGEAGGPLRVVIGIGLNVHTTSGLDAGVTADGGAAPAALDQLGPGPVPARNRVVASLLTSLHRHLAGFSGSGFGRYAADFSQQDYLLGQTVSVQAGNSSLVGVARGIGADGALLVEVGGQVQRVVAGDVTLRRAP